MTKTSRLLFAAWLVLSGAAGSPTPCLADAAVTLKPTVEVKAYAVKLSDLFEGVPAAIDRDIAQAPAPCQSAVYDQPVLNKLADTYRLDWQPQNGVDQSTVTSACTRITTDIIRAAVVARLKQDTSAKGRSFDVAFDTRTPEADLPGTAKPDFALENFTYDPATRRFKTYLSAQTPRGPYTMPVTGWVDIERQVPVLVHRLEAGETIGADDIDWIKVPEQRISSDIVTDANQLIGRELRRDKAGDDMFHARDVMPPRLVLRGTLVTMKIQTPLMTITAQGKAQEDGALGDTVNVINTQSHRLIEGTVTAPGVVEVRTAQRLASAD
ncbi:MAG: flagellar basal body P-ring formation protein FlgA [Alphaproteobacteria bacterium]|nr:flagellar basal body P-ring formation protein FlgA [Alphaproteobacteria bacterium]